MGTSTSSTGPNSEVSLDPPWLNDVIGDIGSDSSVPPGDTDPAIPQGAPGIAPPARYQEARREFGRYLKNGSTQHVANALGHYSSKGSGGARSAARRMRASTQAGAALFSFLRAVSQGSSPEAKQWVEDLRATNPSSEDVIDAIVRELAPPGGSADEESLRDSMAIALSNLLQYDPSVDPLTMREDDIWELLKGYLAAEVANRVCFDLGPIFESSKLDPTTVVLREREMRLFIKNEIGSQLDLLRGTTINPTRAQVDAISQDTLEMTFILYESDL